MSEPDEKYFSNEKEPEKSSEKKENKETPQVPEEAEAEAEAESETEKEIIKTPQIPEESKQDTRLKGGKTMRMVSAAYQTMPTIDRYVKQRIIDGAQEMHKNDPSLPAEVYEKYMTELYLKNLETLDTFKKQGDLEEIDTRNGFFSRNLEALGKGEYIFVTESQSIQEVSIDSMEFVTEKDKDNIPVQHLILNPSSYIRKSYYKLSKLTEKDFCKIGDIRVRVIEGDRGIELDVNEIMHVIREDGNKLLLEDSWDSKHMTYEKDGEIYVSTDNGKNEREVKGGTYKNERLVFVLTTTPVITIFKAKTQEALEKYSNTTQANMTGVIKKLRDLQNKSDQKNQK